MTNEVSVGKRLRLVAVLLVLAVLAAAGAACSSSPATTTTTTPPTTTTPVGTGVAAIRAYADPATTTTLEGLSEDNMAKYTQYANAQFKAAVTQAVLDQSSAQLTAQLGAFKSITFLSTEEQEGYTIVHYKAAYSKGETGVRMVFDADHKIAGQWFEQ